MVWAGSPFAQRIEFATGFPTGAISYQLWDNNGAKVLDSTVTPEAGSVSHLLVIDASYNTCNTPVLEVRTLVWSYQTADSLVTDRVTYRINQPVPFAVSSDGVRAKLGLADDEVAEKKIDLIKAYHEFASLVPADTLTAAQTSGDYNTLLVQDAIEAIAALALMPTLQVELAQKENSGTNEFSRFTRVDWDRLEMSLALHVAKGRAALDDTFGTTDGESFVFGTVPPATDALTGATS